MFYNVHTHCLSSSQEIIELYNQYPSDWNQNNSLFSIGIHPIHIKEDSINREINIIEEKITNKKCLAIGEIGLDKLCNINFSTQLNVFQKQLQIAQEHNIPVIIHCVRAYQEIFHMRKILKINVPFIFHGFNKNEKLLKQILQHNCYVSIGKYILHNRNLQTMFKNVSPSNFFLENDASNISIKDIYTFVSRIKKISIEELKIQQAENWKVILGYS